MSESAWRLAGNVARLKIDEFEATVDLSPMVRGIAEVRAADGLLADARLLAIATPSSPGGHTASLVDRYARGKDLVAVYEESENWPVD